MVKQTKTFKKGNVTKKALSAILAASMVMTSSSFVMAAPADVAVEDVAVETAAPETEDVVVGAEEATEETTEAEAVEETEEAAEEENVGVAYKSISITFKNNITKYEYTGSAIEPEMTVTGERADGKGTDVLSKSNYEVTYLNNKKVGTAEVLVKTLNYETAAEARKTFDIVPRQLTIDNTTVTYDIPEGGYYYTGGAQKPNATVTVDMGNGVKKTLDASDYDLRLISGADFVNAGDKVIALNIKNANYKDTTLATNSPSHALGYAKYAVVKAPFNKDNITVTSRTLPVDTYFEYRPSDVKEFVTVKNHAGVALADGEYKLTLYDANGNKVPFIKGVGTYKISVAPISDNYEDGTVDSTVTIGITTLEDALETAVVYVNDKPTSGHYVEYNGEERRITDIELPDIDPIYWDDYDVHSKVVATDAGYNLVAEVIGKGFFEGQTATVTVAIRPRTITTANTYNKNFENYKEGTHFFGIKADLGRTNSGKLSDNAVVALSCMGTPLEEGKDYSYTTDKESGKVIITGLGNYTTVSGNAKTVAFAYKETKQKFLNDPSIVGTVKGTYNYTGDPITPDVLKNVTLAEKDGSYTLKAGVDYETTAEYKNNVNAGTAKIILTGKGEYSGSKKVVTFKINGKSFSDTFKLGTIKDVSAGEAATDGEKPVVTYVSNGKTASTSLYDLAYYVNGVEIETGDARFKEPGTEITVVVTGKEQYEGKLTTTYKVLGYDISKFVKAEAIADQDYTGKAVEPFVKVRPIFSWRTLKNGRDYTISYKNNVEVGTATAIVTGIGQYSGTVTVPFKIVGQMEQTIDVLDVQERDLGNGTRTLNSKGTKIKYTVAPKTAVTYTSSNPDVVSVDAEGNIKYTGLGEATIKIVAAESDIYKAASVEVKVVVTLKRPTMTLFTRNNAFTFTTSTVNGAKQFEIQYATNKEFENAESKVYSTTGKLRQVKVSAKDKTTYYVRIRAINGSTKTAWSAYKTVATK